MMIAMHPRGNNIAEDHTSGSCQSIAGWPAARSAALMRENGRVPKKPLRAESGEGCADSMITWRLASISALFLYLRSLFYLAPKFRSVAL